MKNGAVIAKQGKYRGAGGLFGSAPKVSTPYEAPDSLRSTQHASLIDLLSEGPIQGLADSNWNPITGVAGKGINGGAAVWFNQCPLANDPNSMSNNFQGVSVVQQVGWSTQPVLPGYTTAEDTVNVGVTLKHNIPYIFSIDDPATTRVSVAIRVPELLKQDDKGNVLANAVGFWMQMLWNNTVSIGLGGYEIQGKCTSDYVREYMITLPHSVPSPSNPNPAPDFWEITVIRYWTDDADSKHVSTIILDYYTRHVDTPLMYPYSAVVGVQVDASQLSDIPTRAYRVKGIMVLVPTNYFPEGGPNHRGWPSYNRDPYTGNDTGIYQPWNGTFYLAWTNNPAWIFYDMATNNRYGAGEFLGNNIDKWALYQIALYCDQGVPDGYGGYEPRFTCNTYIQAQEQAWKVLSDLASVFRGMLYWGQGQVVAVADMPKSVMHNFTNANVVDGRFTYQDAEVKNRNSDAEVTYNDPQDFFSTKTQSVYDLWMRNRYGYRDSKFTSFGCTSRGQARRHGTYLLTTNRYETETVVFQTGFEAMYLRPGDIIGIADNYRIGIRQGGRVKSWDASGHWITLDAVISPFPDGQEIFFYIARDTTTIGDWYPDSNAAQNERLPTSWMGYIWGMGGAASATIYCADPTSGGPIPIWLMQPGIVFVIGANVNTPLQVPVAQWRILTIAEKSPNVYEITATNFEADKYNLIDFGQQFQVPTYTRIPSLTYVLPPNNLTAQLQLINNNNVITVNILVTWEQPPELNIRSYQVWEKAPNTGWFYVTETTSTEFTVQSAMVGVYGFRVASMNTAAIASTQAEVDITVPDTSLIKPHRMSGLEIQGQGSDYGYHTVSPTIAWRLNSPSNSFEFNSEAPYGASVGNYDPYFVYFAVWIIDANTGVLGWADTTQALQYTIDYGRNCGAWGDGKPRHRLIVALTDVDAYGIEYERMLIIIDNGPPPAASNLVATVAAGAAPKAVQLTWTDPRWVPATAPESIDVASINVYQGPDDIFAHATRIASFAANTNIWTGIINSGNWNFFVTYVDAFGTEGAFVGVVVNV